MKIVEQVVKGVILAMARPVVGVRVRERRRRIAGYVGITVRVGSVGVNVWRRHIYRWLALQSARKERAYCMRAEEARA